MAEEGGVGSRIVWVQRKNGLWWPGTLVAPPSATRAQVKLLASTDSYQYWFNLERSRHIKAFRCGEFDGFIRKAEALKALRSNQKFYNAILLALELESQVVQKKLKRPGSEAQQESCSRVKRSKCIYFSKDSRDLLEDSVQSHPSKRSPNPFHSSAENASEATETDSFETQKKVQARNSKAPSDIYLKKQKSMNRKSQGVISNSTESSVDDKAMRPSIPRKCKLKKKLSVKQISERAVAQDDDRSCVLDYKGNSHHFGSVFSSNAKETLIDAQIKVVASNKGVHVPLVCMMSRLNGMSIIGHPVNIEVVEGAAETRVSKNLGENLFYRNMNGPYQLVWKTSKRTPVVYEPPRSSTCENQRISQACESFGDSALSARKSHLSKADKFPVKSSKKKISDRPRIKDSVACIPVELIISKLLAAVSKA